MATKVYRLKIRKVPLADDVIYKKPSFPAFGELYLDLLENKQKLKKNPRNQSCAKRPLAKAC